MEKEIKLGRITAPVGIKGEVRVYPYTDDQTRFSDMEKVCVAGRELFIDHVRYQKDMAVIKFRGVSSRNDAELLRGKELSLPRDEMYELDEDSYFVDDLVGIEVRDETGALVGTLRSVTENPAHDLYEIEKPDGSSFLLPAVKAFVLDIDTENGVMTIRLIEGLV
jgi:16S rRNA processing protein RimM